jgi:hypothetical protein
MAGGDQGCDVGARDGVWNSDTRGVYAAYSRFSKQAMGTMHLASTAYKAMSSLGAMLALWRAAAETGRVSNAERGQTPGGRGHSFETEATQGERSSPC